MSGITLKSVDPAVIPIPTADKNTIFIDSTTADTPSYKDDTGTVFPLGTTGPPGPTGRMGEMIPASDGDDGQYIGPFFDYNEFAKLRTSNIFLGHNTFKSYSSIPYDNGLSGATKTIDWNNGNEQLITLDTNCTFTLSNPSDGGRYILIIKGGFTILWPTNVRWPSSVAPTISGSTKYDLVTFLYLFTLDRYVASFNQDYVL